MTSAEITDKQAHEKMDAILKSCMEAETVPMEHEIVIKFVTNSNISIKDMLNTSKEDVQKAIKEDTDIILEAMDKFVKEYIHNNDRRGLTVQTYVTSPLGFKECIKRQSLKKLLSGLAGKL